MIKGKKAFIFRKDISWDDRSPWGVTFLVHVQKKIRLYSDKPLNFWSSIQSIKISTKYPHTYICTSKTQGTGGSHFKSALHCMVWRDKENAQESTMGLKKIMAFPRPISKSIIIGKIVFFFYFFFKNYFRFI